VWETRWRELSDKYAAARGALQKAFVALERREETIAALQRRLLDFDEERAHLVRRAELGVARLEESQRSAERLFAAFCASLPGRCLGGRFEVVQRIGSGGYGVVYQAVDRRAHRDVALKVLRAPEGGGQTASEPPLDQLAHPNIATVLETGTSPEGISFVVMELLRGKNLAELLEPSRALSVGQAACIARELCLGLAEAHRWDIVHRDIKPSNVFLARQRRGVAVKILDFGLARVVRAPEVEEGPIAGSPPYVAPERLHKEPYDFRVDIYAVGLLLYEMLGCRLSGRDPGGWTAQWRVAPPALHELRGDVPREVAELAARAVRRSPAHRPTADELAARLAPYAEPLDRLSELLCRPSPKTSTVDDVTLESLERQSLGESDTVPLAGGAALAIRKRTTTPAAASPNAPVTNAAVPSILALRSQSCSPFFPPGQTQRKPTPSS
jgi:serine/threonine protein kinase